MFRLILIFLGLLIAAGSAVAQTPMEAHLGWRLEGSGQWRTPNPDHDPTDPNSPIEFGLNFAWGPHRQHVTGELVGLTQDGRSARYQTLYVFLDPMTDTIITQQVAWDGTFGEGRRPAPSEALGVGGSETVDIVFRRVDGSAQVVRHVNTLTAPDQEASRVFERGDDGHWELQREWIWTLLPDDGESD